MKISDTENNSKNQHRDATYFTLLLIAAITTIMSIGVGLWIAENLFFDKLFYQKSAAHGYWPSGEQNRTLASFGKRGRDIQELKDFAKDFNPHEPNKALGIRDNEVFTIAVFGDSLVWGNGLREKDRFVTVLEEKLSEITKTKILSFAHPGDSFLDNSVKLQMAHSYNPDIDLSIFTIVDNDLFFNEETRYSQLLYKRAITDCDTKQLLLTTQFEPIQDNVKEHERYMSNLEKSFSDEYGNYCVFEKIVSRLPQDRTMYFLFGPQFSTPWMIERLKKTLEDNKLTIVTPETLSEIEFGTKEWKAMFVSQKELHPSAKANSIFAEKLFQEITQNPRWGFTYFIQR